MKVLKRNQLIILVVSLMLITAGYLNFTTNQENVATSTIADRSDAAIGDAEFVSTIPHEENVQEENTLVENNNVTEESCDKQDNNVVETNTAEVETKATPQDNSEDYYFTTSKLERNNMYSELLETYQEIYNNANATAEAKTDAITKINSINAIMIAENLILAKGFKDAVIFVNEGSVSVVVKTDELKQEEVAQIQNIVARELNVGAEIIHISNK